MKSGKYVALRGSHSFHMVDRRTIRDVEIGARLTRIFTPSTMIEIENHLNREALYSLCEGPLQKYTENREKGQALYPRLTDLPF